MTRIQPYFGARQHELIPDSHQVSKTDAQYICSFPELVREAAWLSNTFPHQLLFYRGQTEDYKNRDGATTLFPAIYRSDPLRREEVIARYEVLYSTADQLVSRFNPAMRHNAYDLRRSKYIQWSILQHYDVCPTPLLDVTHSLRVACSFALTEKYWNIRIYLRCWTPISYQPNIYKPGRKHR